MKTLIAVPCGDMVHTDFMTSLIALQKPPDTSFTVVKNTLVHVARNRIAANENTAPAMAVRIRLMMTRLTGLLVKDDISILPFCN